MNNLKVTYVNLYKIIMYGVVFMNLGYLGFTQTNNSLIIQAYTSAIAVITFLIYLTQPKKTSISKVMLCYIVMIIVELSFQLLRLEYLNNGISIVNGLHLIYTYSFTLFFFPILEILKKDKKFTSTLVVLAIGALLVIYIAWYLYNYRGINIMPGLFDAMGEDWIRNGMVRVSGTFLDGLCICYLFIKLLNRDGGNETKKIYIILGILFIYAFSNFVYQSRSQIIAYTVTMVVIYLAFRKGYNINSLLKYIIAMLLLIIIYNLPMTQNLIMSLSLKNDGGMKARVLGLHTYMNLWKEISLINGIGISQDGNYFGFLKFYLSDLGILSSFIRFGVLGGAIFSSIFGIALVRVFLFFNTNKVYSSFLLGLTVYLLMTSIGSQNIYDGSRILMLPIFMAYIELYKVREYKF